MEPLKRTIGYVKPELRKKDDHPLATKPVIKEAIPSIQTGQIKQVKIQPILGDEKAKKIVAWIKDHPEFKWSSMCKKVGIDKGNFKRVLSANNPVIKSEFLPKIEEILKKYGYLD